MPQVQGMVDRASEVLGKARSSMNTTPEAEPMTTV